MSETRQDTSDLLRDRIVSVAMPAQNELGLLFEVVEITHGALR